MCDRYNMWQVFWSTTQNDLLNARAVTDDVVSTLRTDVARFAGLEYQYQCHCGTCADHGQSSIQAALQTALHHAILLKEALSSFIGEASPPASSASSSSADSDDEPPHGSQV